VTIISGTTEGKASHNIMIRSELYTARSVHYNHCIFLIIPGLVLTTAEPCRDNSRVCSLLCRLKVIGCLLKSRPGKPAPWMRPCAAAPAARVVGGLLWLANSGASPRTPARTRTAERGLSRAPRVRARGCAGPADADSDSSDSKRAAAAPGSRPGPGDCQPLCAVRGFPGSAVAGTGRAEKPGLGSDLAAAVRSGAPFAAPPACRRARLRVQALPEPASPVKRQPPQATTRTTGAAARGRAPLRAVLRARRSRRRGVAQTRGAEARDVPRDSPSPQDGRGGDSQRPP
jgi:hypothetical protein